MGLAHTNSLIKELSQAKTLSKVLKLTENKHIDLRHPRSIAKHKGFAEILASKDAFNKSFIG